MAAFDRTGFWSTAGRSVTRKVPTTSNGGKAQKESDSPLGTIRATATARRMQKEAELNAKNNGVEVVPAVPQNGNKGHRSLASAVAEFLEETKLTKKVAYATSLDYFTESCPKQYLENIERRDLLKFAPLRFRLPLARDWAQFTS